MNEKKTTGCNDYNVKQNEIFSRLLSAIDMSIRLNFTSDQRYFVAKTTTKKPRLHVTEAKLFLMACLFEPDALLRVEHRLASGQLQLPFLCNVTKSFR